MSLTADLSRDFWEIIHRELHCKRCFLCFQKGDASMILAVSNPVMEQGHTEGDYKVYAPMSFLDRLGATGDGETVDVTVLSEEAFPQATKIVLRSFDSAIYNSDVKQEIEYALSNIGVIERHAQLQIPIRDLGGYPVEVFISEVEPADLVLCEGDEVVLEFEEPLDQIAPPRPPTPIPETIPRLESMLAEMQQAQPQPQPEGRTLGTGDESQIPEWRRQLGPPRRR
jgi:hypothetical protein